MNTNGKKYAFPELHFSVCADIKQWMQDKLGKTEAINTDRQARIDAMTQAVNVLKSELETIEQDRAVAIKKSKEVRRTLLVW